jgi:hypothetical protein
MKKIIFAIFLMSTLTGFAKNPTKPKVTLTKNAAGDWEFVIHNNTKYYIDEFWTSAIDETHGAATKWHKGHFTKKGKHYIDPGGTMTLTLHDVHEGEYYLWTQDAHAHKGHLYVLHLDHDVDINNSDENHDLIDDIFGASHHDGDEIDLDDYDDQEGEDDEDEDEDEDEDDEDDDDGAHKMEMMKTKMMKMMKNI